MVLAVTEVTVRFRRTIQVTQYEPAESEVILKAVVPEGEMGSAGFEKQAAELMGEASGIVHQALGLPKDTKLPKHAKADGVLRNASTEIPGSLVKSNGTVVGGTKEAVVIPANSGDIPETSAPAVDKPAAAQQKTASSAGDIPEVSTPASQTTVNEAAGAAGPTLAPIGFDVEKERTAAQANMVQWVGGLVKNNKLTAATIKTLYPKYNIGSVNNLRPEQKEGFFQDTVKLLKDVEDAASL